MGKVVELNKIKVYWMERTFTEHVPVEDDTTQNNPSNNTPLNQSTSGYMTPTNSTLTITTQGISSAGQPIYTTINSSGTVTATNTNYVNTSMNAAWQVFPKVKQLRETKEVTKKSKMALIPIYFENRIYFVDKISAYDLYNNVDVTRIGTPKKEGHYNTYMDRYNLDFDVLNGKNFAQKFPILKIGDLEFRTYITEDNHIGAEPV